MEYARPGGGEPGPDDSGVAPAVPEEFDPWASPDLLQAVLADGTRIVVLPVGPGAHDHQLLRAELVLRFAELSAESRHRRFLSSVPQLSEAMLHRLVDTVDNVDHVVLTAQVLEHSTSLTPMSGSLVGLPVGLARLIRDPLTPTVADVAVTVVDQWQRRGVGGLLVWSLAQAALRRGIHTFVADVLATNAAPLALLRHAGQVTRSPTDQGAVHVVAALQPAPPLRAAKSVRSHGSVD